ncbi:MAG: hypothetical protein ACE5G8_12425 [Anaerolineae bacterium]
MQVFKNREQGQGLVEYALLLVLVAVVVIAVLLLLGPQISSIFSQVIVALGGEDPGNPSYTYSIEQFGVSGTAGFGGCTVKLSQTMRVKVTQDGSPVDGASLTVVVRLQTGDDRSFSGTTNASGLASWPANEVIGKDPNGCGRTATASIAGVSKTDGY